MPYDLNALDLLRQRTVRVQDTWRIETYESTTGKVVDSIEFTGADTTNPTAILADVGKRRLVELASYGPDGPAALQSLVSGAGKPLQAAIGDSLTMMTHQAFNILSAARSGGVLTVSATSHDLFAGARCRLDGLDAFDPSIRGTYTVSARLDASTFTVPNPGPDNPSIALGTTARMVNLQRRSNSGPLNWMLILGNQRFELGPVLASSGRRVGDMLQFVPEAVASGASYCWVLGGTNDIYLDNATADTVLTGLRAIHQALIGAGVTPLVCTVPPAVGTSYTAAKAKVTAQVNAALRQDCAASKLKILVDLSAATVDSLSASQGIGRAGYFLANDLHWTQKGAYYAGKRAAADVAARVEYVDTRVASAAETRGFDSASPNILDAGPWLNAGTVSAGVTGTQIGTGLIAERGGTCTGAASCVARADGCGYDAVLSATPAAANDVANIRTNGSTWDGRVVPGVAYRSNSSISVSGVAGSTMIYGYPRIVGTVDGVSVQCVSSGLWPVDSTQLDEDWTGVVENPPFTITGTLSGGGLYTTLYFNGAGSAVTIKTGRQSIRAAS